LHNFFLINATVLENLSNKSNIKIYFSKFYVFKKLKKGKSFHHENHEKLLNICIFFNLKYQDKH
jgi:hypothetical protein